MQNHDYTQDKSTAPKDVREATSTFTHERKKFATQMDARLLQRLRDYAKSEGRQIHLALHDMQLRLFGGAPGIRDMGQLESALFRPQTGYYKDIVEEAAALWESFMQNHPFVDGNKRTALNVTLLFLDVNGVECTASEDNTTGFIYGLFDASDVSLKRHYYKAWANRSKR